MSDRIGIMRAGRIEQVGTPRELYTAPTSEFVATFLGNANFLDGVVVEVAGESACVALGDGVRVALPGSYPPGQALRLMVRPEHLALATAPGPLDDGATRVAAQVQEAVYLGAGVQYRVGALGRTFVVHASGPRTQFAERERVWLQWRREDLRVIASPKPEER